MKRNRWILIILVLIAGLLAGCGQPPPQANVFEKGKTVVNAELTRIVYVGDGLICGYDDEHQQEFYLSLVNHDEQYSAEQTASRVRYSGVIQEANEVNIHIDIQNAKDIKVLENNRDPEVDREETQEELDEQLMERAVEANFEEMMTGEVEETSVYIVGQVSSIGEGHILYETSFFINDGEHDYYVEVIERLPNISKYWSEVKEGSMIKLYGGFVFVDKETGLPWIDGRIIEIIE